MYVAKKNLKEKLFQGSIFLPHISTHAHSREGGGCEMKNWRNKQFNYYMFFFEGTYYLHFLSDRQETMPLTLTLLLQYYMMPSAVWFACMRV